MNIDHLVAHGFPPEVIAHWRTGHAPHLLPLQEKAGTGTAVLRGGNLVVFAPTSSGKTFVAELAAVKQVLAGRKAVFLVPTKALAEEQHAHLSRTYAPLGMRTAIATRERVRDDADIAAGAFDLAVMVYEKFKAFLAVVPEMLSRTGVVVVDELQILGDPERGGLVDLLLAKILAAPQPVQLVCLSAVLGENSRLASWLRSELLVWRQRPVELREGALVLPDGAFIYREFNSGREEKEDLLHQGDRRAEAVQPDAESFNFPAVAAATQELVRRGEQVLIFVPTRHLSRQWAYQLSRTLDLPAQGAGAPDPATLESLAAELRNHEESHSREILAQCFERAVGVHNADLPQDLRGLVERQFNSGTLRVLVATSTLAQGVNLSCRNVISVPVMVGEDAVTGATGFVPLSRQRFRNQGGRGGRLSSGEPFGRSIIVAEDERDASHIMREFVFADPEPLDAPIRQADIARFALDLVGCEAAADFAALRAMMISTYTGTIAWSIRPEHLNAEIERAVDRLLACGMLQQVGDGALAATGLGQAVAAYGIAIPTAEDFASWCRARAVADERGHAGFPVVAPFEVLALCALSRDGEMFPLPLTAAERDQRHFAREFAARADIRAETYPPPLRERLTVYGGFNEAAQSALKKALLAELWITPAPTPDIEEAYRTFAGTIGNLAAHFGWLAQALAACAAALGVPDQECRTVRSIAERLPDGVLAEGVPLSRLGVPGLTRQWIAALVREGYDSAQAVAHAPEDALAQILTAPLAARLLNAAQTEVARRATVREQSVWWQLLHPKAVETPAPTTDADARMASGADTGAADTVEPDLCLSLNSPGQVRFRGVEVLVRPMPFQLLALLANTPGRVVSYRDIDESLWPDNKVEQQQILAHRAAIVAGIAKCATREEATRLIRVVKGQGLMLDLAPERVRLEARH